MQLIVLGIPLCGIRWRGRVAPAEVVGAVVEALPVDHGILAVLAEGEETLDREKVEAGDGILHDGETNGAGGVIDEVVLVVDERSALGGRLVALREVDVHFVAVEVGAEVGAVGDVKLEGLERVDAGAKEPDGRFVERRLAVEKQVVAVLQETVDHVARFHVCVPLLAL